MPYSRVLQRRPSLAVAALGFMLTVSNAYAQAVLVNTASDGTPANGNGTVRSFTIYTALDDSGRYVVFADNSTNLVTGDGNGSVDVFVKDRTSNATTRVSVASDGTERTGDSGLTGVDVSGDGQIVVFTSKAALVANDTNSCGDPGGRDADSSRHKLESGADVTRHERPLVGAGCSFGLDATTADGALDPDGDGQTNLQEYEAGTHPRGVFKRYLAEGAVNAFFTTRLAIANPNAQKATVQLRFLGTSGLQSAIVDVARPNERRTLNLTPQTNIPENDFSTVIESDQPVVVDRTMTWDAATYGGHAETALEAPATTWYLAEGATHGAFSLFYLLQNPNDTDASVTVNYLRLAPETPVVKQYTVPAKARLTIAVDAEGPELEATDVAARIDSTLPIIVERAMYSTAAGQPPFAAGHGGAGVTATALKWFLAEGATGNFFDLYVLVANPPRGRNGRSLKANFAGTRTPIF